MAWHLVEGWSADLHSTKVQEPQELQAGLAAASACLALELLAVEGLEVALGAQALLELFEDGLVVVVVLTWSWQHQGLETVALHHQAMSGVLAETPVVVLVALVAEPLGWLQM